MDNRFRFLYRIKTELWGRMWKARAGNEKTGASEEGVKLAKPLSNPKT